MSRMRLITLRFPVDKKGLDILKGTLNNWVWSKKLIATKKVLIIPKLQNVLETLKTESNMIKSRLTSFVQFGMGTLFYALSSYVIGYTFICLVGYPACVCGKSMQPALNLQPVPLDWTFQSRTPKYEDPFWQLYPGSQYNTETEEVDVDDDDLLVQLWTQDWVWVNTWRARNMRLEQGDIAVYISPKASNDYVIKRVMALEGDIVTTDRYDSPYVRIPEGHLWLEGDNWDNSVDSNKYGPVSKGLVFGVATHIIWPPYRWQSLAVKVLPPELEPERIITSTRLRQARAAYR